MPTLSNLSPMPTSTPSSAKNTATSKQAKKAKTSPLLMIPLGGEQEIGKNTWVFQYEDDIILLDAGLAFPDATMPGVNIVLPDVSYLKQNRDKIRGMIVTHGHEDHIGGIPYHLREFDIPVIYGPKLALALLEEKLKEVGLLNRTELRTVGPREMVRLGKSFVIDFIRNTHSFADSFTIALMTPVGVVIQTGDFKMDHTPVDGEYFDLARLAEHGEKGVLCLISDSTNAEVPGYTPSEQAVFPGLSKAIAEAPGRVIITTFASSVHRINIILQIAERQGKVVCLQGRSMLNVVAHARRLGYIRCKDETLQPMQVINQKRDSEVIILTTGSQGEPLSALTRIANGEHRQVEIREGDTVIFSANPIPGNVIPVVRLIDKLMLMGARVVYGKEKGIHVSGHGCQEDQKLMLALTKPKFFVPTHGEYRMLIKHADTAVNMGVAPENIVIANNGDVVSLTEDSLSITDRVPSGVQFIDESRTGVVLDEILQQRQQLAKDGMVMVAVTLNGSGQMIANPQVQTVGLAGDPQSLSVSLIQSVLEADLEQNWSRFARSMERGTLDVDWAGLKDSLERAVRRCVRERLQSKPTIVLMLQHPESESQSSQAEAQSDRQADPQTTVSSARTRKRRSAAAVAS